MRAALFAAVLVVVALSAALVMRTYQRQPAATEAPVVCTARDVKPPPIHPELSAVPLLVNHPRVTVRIDGSEQLPTALLAGVHQLEASAPETRASSFAFVVRAATPVLLDARVVEGAVTVLLLGARCKSCEVARTDIDVRFQQRALGNLGDAATALSSGDWSKAANALRAIPDDERVGDFFWLHGVLLAFAGQPSKALEQLRRLPGADAIHQEETRFNASTAEAPQRLLATATTRWNATAERFDRITVAFSADAPELVTQLTQRFSKFSDRFSSALAAKDAIETEAALDDATNELTIAVDMLRLRHADCAWQQRVTATF